MPLFLQLNLAGLPGGFGGDLGAGLLQMFYCTGSRPVCEVAAKGWEPFSACHLLRLVEPTAGGARVPMPAFDGTFRTMTITGWEETDDYPHPWECLDFGIELDDDEIETLNELGYPRQGDKLFGWPAWVQHVDYPNCRRCGRWMWPVFQIDSDCNVWYMFGDDGCGHITQCPEHKDELAFAWACC
jgi:hypothetical protein